MRFELTTTSNRFQDDRIKPLYHMSSVINTCAYAASCRLILIILGLLATVTALGPAVLADPCYSAPSSSISYPYWPNDYHRKETTKPSVRSR